MDTKSWYKSKTIWGGLMMLVAAILSQFTGVQLSAEEQETGTNMLVGIAEGGAALVGFVLVIVGRVKAKENIVGSKQKAEGSNPKNLFIIFLLPVLGLVSCTSIQSAMTTTAQIDLKNAAATRQLAKDLLSTWRLNSGFIMGALGPKVGELPNQAIEAMRELDEMAKKTDLDDYDLGYSLGARVRMLSSIIGEVLRLYAPEALKYAPLIMSL